MPLDALGRTVRNYSTPVHSHFIFLNVPELSLTVYSALH